MALPSGSMVKNPPANAGETGDVGLMPGGGNSNPLQYSCVENLMDSGAWRATVHGVQRVGNDLGHTHIYRLGISSTPDFSQPLYHATLFLSCELVLVPGMSLHLFSSSLVLP